MTMTPKPTTDQVIPVNEAWHQLSTKQTATPCASSAVAQLRTRKMADREISEFLSGVVGAVEATSCEKMYLWQEYHRRRGDPWVDRMDGYGRTVGTSGEMPVHISLLTSEVRGNKILFYHATSQVVDHRLIEAWLDSSLPSTARWPDGRLNKTDAMNFHNVFRAPAELVRNEQSTTSIEPRS